MYYGYMATKDAMFEKLSRLGTGKGYGPENFVSERDMKIAALMKNAKS